MFRLHPQRHRWAPIWSKAFWRWKIRSTALNLADANKMIAALSNAGYVIVPKEPTAKMLHAMTMEPPTWDDEISRRKWKVAVSAI